MAVGPSLRQLHAHQAIHDGGLSGAISKTADFINASKTGDTEQINIVLDDLLDYWETRIIGHADSEEDGFYQELVEHNPSLQETVTKLIRDHDLLKIIVADIYKLRETEGLSGEILPKLQALIVVNGIHSRDEERLLFGN
ncbi:MAG TPA: hemerythrin domain-containing protein [Candidatus Paenibacillus intestinavium]|nr:hemerythrin domain-containing protein [Candidatus Paenibacillus intestinavium]